MEFYAILTNPMMNGRVDVRFVGVESTLQEATKKAKAAWVKNSGNTVTVMTGAQIERLIRDYKAIKRIIK
jgi:hypothetical protein